MLCTGFKEGVAEGSKGVGIRGHRPSHSARLEEYGQWNYPEVFGVDTAGTLAGDEPSVRDSLGRMSSGACHLFKMTGIVRLRTLKSVKTETVHYGSDPAI